MSTDFRHFAACRANPDPDLWFPPGPGATTQIRQAKAICAGCPVIADCLNYAFETGQNYGVFGGLTADERRSHRRKLVSESTGSEAAA